MNNEIKELENKLAVLKAHARIQKAFDSLNAAQHPLWEVRHSLNFDNSKASVAIQAARDAIEVAMRELANGLGRPERVAALVKCGMDLDRLDSYDLTTDKEAASCLATWLFDKYGRYDYVQGDIKERALIMENFPLGMEFYQKGQHDT